MMGVTGYILIAAGVLITLLLCYAVKTYNVLVKARNRVKTQWAQIDVQLIRRADLIPNLVECVKGYSKHEKETLERVMEARSALTRAGSPGESMNANDQVSAALSRLFAVAEAYPELKADRNFAQLHSDLRGTEDKIAHSRQFYNDTVLRYKDKLQQFPANIFASIFGFREENFLAAQEDKRKNVSVRF